jgi:type I restriction enzyme R subunit
MAYQDKTSAHIRLDERTHVEKPLLDQLKDLGWEVLVPLRENICLPGSTK